MGTTKSKGRKDALDRFYTKPSIARQCINLIDKIEDYDVIIEPSAGSGSFSNQIKCDAYDISPQGENIITANWLELDKSKYFDKKVLVLGNPPFGQQNSLAINFFNESATFCSTIAFILPLSFKKRSIQDKLNYEFWLEKEWVLPTNSFEFDGEEYDVPCVFQIWKRRTKKREKLKIVSKTNLFQFVKNRSDADLRIQRVGGNAGKASSDLNFSEQSNYFIKNTSGLSNEDFIKLINSTEFSEIAYTVGPKSLSKTELILTLEEQFNKQTGG